MNARTSAYLVRFLMKRLKRALALPQIRVIETGKHLQIPELSENEHDHPYSRMGRERP